jgi:acetylornithine deacetylase/succinyl-diaminopimelate desuccinylase-like protein
VRHRMILALGILTCGLVSSLASAQAAPDWQAVEAEAIRTIQAYVRINTSNPPGDVTKAADFLTGLLQREGIPVKRYEPGPGRAIILARLKGAGTAKPLLLLHHMDVPPIRPDGSTIRLARKLPTERSGAAARST